jgi:hypothetical protein
VLREVYTRICAVTNHVTPSRVLNMVRREKRGGTCILRPRLVLDGVGSVPICTAPIPRPWISVPGAKGVGPEILGLSASAGAGDDGVDRPLLCDLVRIFHDHIASQQDMTVLRIHITFHTPKGRSHAVHSLTPGTVLLFVWAAMTSRTIDTTSIMLPVLNVHMQLTIARRFLDPLRPRPKNASIRLSRGSEIPITSPPSCRFPPGVSGVSGSSSSGKGPSVGMFAHGDPGTGVAGEAGNGTCVGVIGDGNEGGSRSKVCVTEKYSRVWTGGGMDMGEEAIAPTSERRDVEDSMFRLSDGVCVWTASESERTRRTDELPP